MYLQFAVFSICSLQYLQYFSKNIQFQFITQTAYCAKQKEETLNKNYCTFLVLVNNNIYNFVNILI